MDSLQVVAQPRRRKILALIWDSPRSATEIASQFDLTFGAVSQHLGILREAGLVTVEREGNRRIYAADKEALRPFRTILEDMWAETFYQLA